MLEIGNNVTLVFNNMDFGQEKRTLLKIRGKTQLTTNAITVRMTAYQPVKVIVRLDARDGKEIAAFPAQEGKTEYTVPVKGAGIGKHAVYFLFEVEGDGPAAELDRFTFD